MLVSAGCPLSADWLDPGQNLEPQMNADERKYYINILGNNNETFQRRPSSNLSFTYLRLFAFIRGSKFLLLLPLQKAIANPAKSQMQVP
jgi:hypothetical protein